MADKGKNLKRNSEKRKEKSRFAARDRRGRETDIFNDLQLVIPVVPEPTVTHVDRIAVLRLAASLCRVRNFVPYLVDAKNELEESEGEDVLWSEETLKQCLDGFILIFDHNNTIVYISQGVAQFLGLTQTDLVGREMKDFVHPEDLDELRSLSGRPISSQLVVRIKTVISPRGRNLNLKAASFKPFSCQLKVVEVEESGKRLCLLHAFGTGSSVSLADSATGTFMSRHTADMKFSYCNDGASNFLRFDPKSLMGRSFYELVHPADLKTVSEKLKELFKKGNCSTDYYRLLNRAGDAIWVQTDATTVTHTTRGQRGLYVVCRHHVLGAFRPSTALVASNTPVIKVEPCESPSRAEVQSGPHSANPAALNPNDHTKHTIDSKIKPRSQLATDVRRKRSYEEVLEWLVRGSAESPPPGTPLRPRPSSNASSRSQTLPIVPTDKHTEHYHPQYDERRRCRSGPDSRPTPAVIPTPRTNTSADASLVSPNGYVSASYVPTSLQSPVFAANLSPGSTSTSAAASPRLTQAPMLMPPELAVPANMSPTELETNELSSALAPFVHQDDMMTLSAFTDLPLELDENIVDSLFADVNLSELFSNDKKAPSAVPATINGKGKAQSFAAQKSAGAYPQTSTPPMVGGKDMSNWSQPQCSTAQHPIIKGLPVSGWNNTCANAWNANAYQQNNNNNNNNNASPQLSAQYPYGTYGYPGMYPGKMDQSSYSNFWQWANRPLNTQNITGLG